MSGTPLKRSVRRAILSMARKNGKALSLDTKIPTPNGFTTMGDIDIGDTIFDETGSTCRVTFITPIQYERKCYKINFSDGSEFIADADHQWSVYSKKYSRRNNVGKKLTLTTAQMLNDYKYGNREDRNEFNYSVDIAGPIHCQPKVLPIPPYTFGVWLGDGDINDARITCSDIDIEIMENVMAEGVPAKRAEYELRTPTWRLTDGIRNRTKNCIKTKLRDVGVLGNKHIPEIYQRASIDQRMALLQGLMDTDGSITNAGQCCFEVCDQTLASDVLQLIRGLGFKASLVRDRAKLNGFDCGERQRIQFWAFNDRPVFRLKRKTDRQIGDRGSTRTHRNYITNIEPIESVPVRCITVDSQSSLYLIGESFTPTHNTALIAALVLAHLIGPLQEKNGEIYSCANDREQAAQVFKFAKQFVEASPILSGLLRVVPSTKTINHYGSGSFYRAISAESGTKHGLNPSVVIYDELAQSKSRDLFDVMDSSMGARIEPLFITISTQSHDPQHILSQLIDDGLSGRDPACVVHLYCANDNADVLDEDAWEDANPALDDFRSKEELKGIMERAVRLPALEATARNLYLNQRVSPETPLITRHDWQQCNGESELVLGEEILLSLDLSGTLDLTALVAASLEDPTRVKAHFWKPKDTVNDHEQRDRVPYKLWSDQGYITLTEGRSIDKRSVALKIAEYTKDYKVIGLAYDRWRIGDIIRDLDAIGLESYEGTEGVGLRLYPWGQGFRDMAPAIEAFEKAVIDQNLLHGGNPVLTWNVANAIVVADPANNRKLDKTKSRFRIDGAVALAMVLGFKARYVSEIEPPKEYTMLFL